MSFLLDKDPIYVGGSNTRSTLALWCEWGLDKILRRAWNEGVVLGNVSSRPNAKAYRVEKVSGKIEERPLESVYLEQEPEHAFHHVIK